LARISSPPKAAHLSPFYFLHSPFPTLLLRAIVGEFIIYPLSSLYWVPALCCNLQQSVVLISVPFRFTFQFPIFSVPHYRNLMYFSLPLWFCNGSSLFLLAPPRHLTLLRALTYARLRPCKSPTTNSPSHLAKGLFFVQASSCFPFLP